MGITFKINVQFILNEYDEKLNFKQINPPVSPEAQIQCQKNYRRMKIKEFLSADFETKKIWVRQKIYHMLDHQNIYQ